MKRRLLRAFALVALTAVAVAPAARATGVEVVVVPHIDIVQASRDGAVGLLVPGAGSTVTRAGARSSLVRGKVVSSLLGGRATGTPLIELSPSKGMGQVTIYVELPPAGRTHNTRRYPVWIVGGGYGGILVSDTTRIPGLISIADIAPTAVDLEHDRTPVIRSRESRDAVGALADLDRRLQRSHDARTGATIVLVAVTLVLAALGLLLQSRFLARAGLAAIPSALTVALVLAGAGVSRPGVAVAALAAGSIVLAFLVAARGAALQPSLLVFLVGFLIVLAASPETNALAIIGPHPDGGGRYYGVTNQVETLLLVPILASVALAPPLWLLPLGLLSLVLVGWSKAGADGGGIAVVLAVLAAFWVFRERIRVTPARIVLAVLIVVAIGLALVGIDALTDGSSHVTHAVGGGPDALAGDLWHRLRVSWKGVTATTQAGVAAGATLAALVLVGSLRPRVAAVDAMLVGLAVSLLVNDTPTDVLAYGALGVAALGVWAVVDAAPRWRSGAGAYLRASRAPYGR